jgi:hypothetical protein
MKLRIHDNSIRLRLTRSEVARFAAEGAIESVFEFGPGSKQRLRYALEASATPSVQVCASDGRIAIQVPRVIAREWWEGDRVGISARQPLSGDKQLDILVEKEFRRLHGAKFDPDLYPNPLEPQNLKC